MSYASEAEISSERLLTSRKLGPLFITQFTGAFNDNFYKSALLMLFTFGEISRWGLDINVINNLVAATLIVPFLLFAVIAGQYSDKYEKTRIIRAIKVAEILIMCGGALALWLNSPAGLLLVLFFTGTQSACFSPLKYAIIPQLVEPRELVGANGFIQMGTSQAIFLGLIAGSFAMQLPNGHWVVAWGALALAIMGWLASRMIPPTMAMNPDLRVRHNPFSQAWKVIGYARENPVVFWAIMGISWYWFLGSIYLTQLPNLARSVLGGDKPVVTLLLFLFLLGLSVGALWCSRLSQRRVEPGVVPLGILGIIVFGVDLYFAAGAIAPAADGAPRGVSDLAATPGAWRVMADIFILGIFGGIYNVPLLSLMQSRCRDGYRAQVVGANNVINAIFMVLAAVFGVLVLGVWQRTIPELFLGVVLLTVAFMAILFTRVPEFLRRFKVHILRIGP